LFLSGSLMRVVSLLATVIGIVVAGVGVYVFVWLQKRGPALITEANLREFE
jgi:biopolymer transport protein ExbB/TolQ